MPVYHGRMGMPWQSHNHFTRSPKPIGIATQLPGYENKFFKNYNGNWTQLKSIEEYPYRTHEHVETRAETCPSMYTTDEWIRNNATHHNRANSGQQLSHEIKSEIANLIRETDETAVKRQKDSLTKISERICNLSFWKTELSYELERLRSEYHQLLSAKQMLEKARKNCEQPLYVAQECLHYRQGRQGSERVRDAAEEALHQELSQIRSCQQKLDNKHQRVEDMITENRSRQYEIQRDLNNKEVAMNIDVSCQKLNNYSSNINSYKDVHKTAETKLRKEIILNKSIAEEISRKFKRLSIPESWAEHTNNLLQKCHNHRLQSTQVRNESECIIGECTTAMWNAWNVTNGALSRRCTTILDAKNQLQMDLHKVRQELVDLEGMMEVLRNRITDKSYPLKVAQTRIEMRTHRPDLERCRDAAHILLVKEVNDLQSCVESLNVKLEEAECRHKKLLVTRCNLEKDINQKVNSLFIDNDKCLGIRKTFPITAVAKY